MNSRAPSISRDLCRRPPVIYSFHLHALQPVHQALCRPQVVITKMTAVTCNQNVISLSSHFRWLKRRGSSETSIRRNYGRAPHKFAGTVISGRSPKLSNYTKFRAFKRPQFIVVVMYSGMLQKRQKGMLLYIRNALDEHFIYIHYSCLAHTGM